MTSKTAVFAVLTTLACAPPTPETATAQLGATVATIAKDKRDGARNVVLSIDAPKLGLQNTWAAGVADERSQAAMRAETPFLSASIGKLFIATATVALEKEGALSLDDRLDRWLTVSQFTGLPVTGGDDALAGVTLRQLLNHTSGLPDSFGTATSKASDGAPSVLGQIVLEPGKRWSREQLFDYTRAHYQPVGAPGAQFIYSDVNYDLLGLVLEAVTKKPYQQVVREKVITPAGLTHTWYHEASAPPAGMEAWADTFVENANVARSESLSADQAGGGLATTAEDLRRFMRSLRKGTPVSLEALAPEWRQNALTAGVDYALGMWRIRPSGLFFGFGALPDVIGVSGATGSFVYYVERSDAVISGTFNQTKWQEGHISFIVGDVLPLLEQLPRVEP